MSFLEGDKKEGTRPSQVFGSVQIMPQGPYRTQGPVFFELSIYKAKASKKAVLRVRCLRSVSSMGSNGAFVSSLRTTERFHLGKFLELLGRPCESWRVTCEGLHYVEYVGPLGAKCQRLQSCNHQWSRGACLGLGTGT